MYPVMKIHTPPVAPRTRLNTEYIRSSGDWPAPITTISCVHDPHVHRSACRIDGRRVHRAAVRGDKPFVSSIVCRLSSAVMIAADVSVVQAAFAAHAHAQDTC